jgi:hypothetical protein
MKASSATTAELDLRVDINCLLKEWKLAFGIPYSDLALRSADRIQIRILGKFEEFNSCDILDPESALDINLDFLAIAYKPNKWTLLHRFTENYLIEEFYYEYRKAGEYFAPFAISILEHYNIPFTRHKNNTREVDGYLLKKLNNVTSKIAHEIFCILFQQRTLMAEFSSLVAQYLQNIPREQFTDYFSELGHLKRSASWPTWLQQALIFRENGCCALCDSDITGKLGNPKKINIDHIIPISKNGTSDPTNLQLLCNDCNQKKGNRNNDVGSRIYIPWELDKSIPPPPRAPR